MPSYSNIVSAPLISIGAASATYATPNDLPTTGPSSGDMAFVQSNGGLYVWVGVGWYSVAIINLTPSITVNPDASYDFATDGTPIVLNLAATDPEGIPITWGYSVTSGSLTNGGGATATISNDGNGQFTITPTTTEAYAGTFDLTFTASDGINVATSSASSFTLQFAFFLNAGTMGSNTLTLIGSGTTNIISGYVRGIYVNEYIQRMYYTDYGNNTICQRNILNSSFNSFGSLQSATLIGRERSYWMATTYDKNGTLVYICDCDAGTTKIKQFSLGTAWDITTIGASPIASFQYSQSGYPYSMSISDDGSKIWVAHENAGIKLLTLSTPFNIASATLNASIFGNTASAAWVHPAGNKVFEINYSSGVVTERNLTVPGDITGGLSNGLYAASTSSSYGLISLCVGQSGQYLYLAGQTAIEIRKYQLY